MDTNNYDTLNNIYPATLGLQAALVVVSSHLLVVCVSWANRVSSGTQVLVHCLLARLLCVRLSTDF